MNFVDALVVVLLLGAAWSGFRRGLISSLLSLIGAVGGAVAAIGLAPLLMSRVEETAAKVAIGIACVVVGIGIGEVAGSTLGRAIAERITWRPARALDHGLGLVGHTLAIAIVTWIVALPIAAIPYPPVTSAIRSSTVLGAVDKVMPTGLRDVSTRMRQLFDNSGFPEILDPLTPSPDVAVGAPDAALARSASLRRAGDSVLKVRGVARSCSRQIEGSSFVIGPEKVLTNAHVVAGTETVTVQQGGTSLPATVVLYDPNRDLAVLDVPGLTRPALAFAAAPGRSGQSAAPAGYPLDGPFTITPGRVSSQFILRGPNIYSSATVNRQVYTLRSAVRPGNSGGPLLSTDGSVLGVVFGAAIDQPDVGFALTAGEVAPDVAAGLTDVTAADTGQCTAE